MRIHEQQYGLWSTDHHYSLPLQGTHVNADVKNLLSEVSISQTYRNDEPDPIEAVYTFPLPLDAVLLGFSVKLGEKQLTGVIQERQQAEEDYEETVTGGDAAIMLQQLEPGLYTVNIGNLLTEESAVIEFRYALLHHWTGDVLRWYLPTVVSPRYGKPVMEAHQVPEVDITVEHRYSLTISIQGLLREAQVECPSHEIEIRQLSDRTRLQLKNGNGFLDRDLVLLIRKNVDKISAVCQTDGDHYVALASFYPEPSEPGSGLTEPKSRLIKILVDSSGSMSGESIAQARIALLNILDTLNPEDRFSLTRFGSHVSREIEQLIEATEENVSRAREIVARMDADLGGTEIFGALEETLQSGSVPADLLLITDGEVWDSRGEESRSSQIIKLANETGQRLFTVGVGSSVSERLVRELAE